MVAVEDGGDDGDDDDDIAVRRRRDVAGIGVEAAGAEGREILLQDADAEQVRLVL